MALEGLSTRNSRQVAIRCALWGTFYAPVDSSEAFLASDVAGDALLPSSPLGMAERILHYRVYEEQ